MKPLCAEPARQPLGTLRASVPCSPPPVRNPLPVESSDARLLVTAHRLYEQGRFP